MANEATVRSGLQILKRDATTGKVLLEYRSQPTTHTADVTGTKGPSPGALTATTAGVNVDLSNLTTPALCRIMNLDATNFVEYGIWTGSVFEELGELLPGESYPLRLSRNLLAGGRQLRVKADTADCNILIEAFEG